MGNNKNYAVIDSQSGQGKSISFECKSLQFMSHEFCLMSQGLS